MIWAEAPATERNDLETAARDASTEGLRVTMDHGSRWPWARQRRARASISEDGTCACSLLSDDADWNAEFWDMDPQIRERLAHALEILATRGPAHLTVEALWIGESRSEKVLVSVNELFALAATGRLGTTKRYIVERAV
jgi:hypothetical protein